jgi:hypothetical protein
MMRGKLSGLMVCALALVAVIVPGHADETSVKASSVVQGQGRFYKATDNLVLFSGYFEGIVDVENQQGALNTASLVCPTSIEVNLTDRTQQGEGRCIIVTRGGDHLYARWSCTGKPLAGCGGPFTITGGTGQFKTVSGQSEFVVRSTTVEEVVTVPEGGSTGNFAGQAQWTALRYRTP